MIDERTKERFWSKVRRGEPDECWEWQASKLSDGYGQFWLASKGCCVPAHRVAYRIERGVWPNITCHTCDNPACVNPRHLYSGTYQTNANDRKLRGRKPVRLHVNYARGERAGGAKLTEKQVSEIRAAYRRGRRGYGLRALAKKYGVTVGAIWYVVNNLTWKE